MSRWWWRAVGLALGACTALGCGGEFESKKAPPVGPVQEQEAPPGLGRDVGPTLLPSLEPSPAEALWVVRAHKPHDQDVRGVASDGAGGAILLTRSRLPDPWFDPISRTDELELTRYDVSGAAVWSRPLRGWSDLAGARHIEGGVLAVSSRGESFVAGRASNADEVLLGDQRYGVTSDFLAKFSADGTLLWVRSEPAHALAADGQGGVLAMVSGGTVTRLDSRGTVLWRWSPPEGTQVSFNVLAADLEGGSVVAGRRVLGEERAQGSLLRLSPQGEVRWWLGTPEDVAQPKFTDVALRPDGGVLLTGTFVSDFTWGAHPVRNTCSPTQGCALSVFLLAVDPDGGAQWGDSVQKTRREWLMTEPRLALAGDGGAVVSWGNACVSDLLRVSPGGGEVWRRQFQSTPCKDSVVVPRDVTFLKDGSLLSAGWFSGTHAISGGRVLDADVQDIYLMRLAP